MDAPPALHPTDQTLHAYGLGKLDELLAEAVNKHLETCPACRRRVAEVSSDSFLGRLRDAQGRPDSLGPVVPSFAGLSMMTGASNPATPPPISSLPPGLADHPDYEVIRELGQGGMGVVYLAQNKLMGRKEVLKVVSSHLVNRRGVLDRFLGEIRNAAQLHHQNVVTAHSALRLDEGVVLAMEYVEGYDLAKLVKAQGPLLVAHACNFTYQAALGLQHAHEKGMVHRDIKPGNLMLSKQGKQAVIKILDFGLAKVKSEGAVDGGLTHEGQMLGTPDFVAPEQTVDARTADIRADIYSLGCTLYYLLTGHAPFQATSLYEILQAHHSMDATPLNLARPEVPVELAAIVARMMAKEPERRFQTPKEVAQALKPFFKSGSAAAVSSKAEVSSPGRLDVVGQIGVGMGRTAVPSPTSKPGRVPASKNTAAPAQTGPSWESLIDVGEAKSSPPEEQTGISERHRERPQWLWPSVAAGFLLLAFLVAWAVVIRIKTKEGDIVLKNVPDQAVVTIDGEKAKVQVPGGGPPIEVVPSPGGRGVQFRRGDTERSGKELTIDTGGGEKIDLGLDPHGTPAEPTASPRASGGGEESWVSLFDGKDLTGWKINPHIPVQWVVQDGVLHTTSNGRLYTEKDDYKNFRLRAELKADANCLGNILFRSTMGPGRESTYAVQINTIQGQTIDPNTGSLHLSYHDPEISEIVRPVGPDLIEPDRWFELEITAMDYHFIVSLDGKEIVNWFDINRTYPTGYIALHRDYRSRGGELYCRKIEICELDASKFSGRVPRASIASRQSWVLPPGYLGQGAASTWAYTTSSPGPGWVNSDFDDRTWSRGSTPFGNLGPPLIQKRLRTLWDSPTIWIRNRVDLPELRPDDELILHLFHDEDVEVYVNGESLFEGHGWLTYYLGFPLTKSKKALFRPGTNTIAARCRQTGGAQGIDLGLKLVRWERLADSVVASSGGQSTKNGPGDALQPGTVWTGEQTRIVEGDPETQKFPITFLVQERKGDTFKARLEVGPNIREIHGTIRGREIRWLARNVKVIKGHQGHDHVGTIQDEEIALEYSGTAVPEGKPVSGTVKLRLEK